MTKQTTGSLDAEELFHCALDASNRKQHDKAIELMKRSIDLEEHPAKHLMLAAEYAEIKMYERAIEGMKTAVEMAPQLWIAQFQLSQLYIVIQDFDKAKKIWKKLLTASDSPQYFRDFAEGLLALSEKETEKGVELLRKGMNENKENPALNGDIEKIIISSINPEPALSEDTEHQDDDSAMKKMLLSRYTQH
ncbi:tetratricopeptide repeat protein [Microbulbifer sp. TYP-18]|uniref:tetratricopeptide repeat protein n=1 Tax=Microbulbifer sp. TYP-18 TaxID=3230024 RepID=UPI0034C6C578